MIFIEETAFLPHMFFELLSESTDCRCVGLFMGCLFCSSSSYVLVPISRCFDLVFLLKIALASGGSFVLLFEF
jgi:hypothetical protein